MGKRNLYKPIKQKNDFELSSYSVAIPSLSENQSQGFFRNRRIVSSAVFQHQPLIDQEPLSPPPWFFSSSSHRSDHHSSTSILTHKIESEKKMDVDVIVTRVATVPNATPAFWKELFVEQFLNVNDPNLDDMVFYVRQSPPAVASNTLKFGAKKLPDNDIMFVKRRTDSGQLTTSEEESNVRWKESFYVNMLGQLHYELAVSICTKGQDNRIKDTLVEKSKRVYASPYKTRMDKKGTEYSYSFPLIYFNVEDFEDAWSELVISEGLHYCVRLFCLLPPLEAGLPQRRITLFAGSVSWNDLSKTFMARTSASIIMNSTEYIMMSGPGGKGHCQVAVRIPEDNNSTPDASPGSSSSSLSFNSTNSSSSSNMNNNYFGNSFIANGKGTLRGLFKGLAMALSSEPQEVTTLRSSLTFVNVSWQSVVNDITDNVLRTRPPTSPSSPS